jgi:hypothetical protein
MTVRDFDVCPDPCEDYEGYCLWQEMHACTYCDGVGEEEDSEWGTRPWVCPHCEGTGIEPGAGDCGAGD